METGRTFGLEESYDYCCQLTKERAKNFYYGIRLLPEARRKSLCAAYAYFRISDDLSDDDSIENRHERLSEWRELARHPHRETVDGREVGPAFLHTVDRYGIPPEYFEELVDGTLSDLTVTRYESFDDLYRYCYRVASTVGLVCLHIFGFDGSQKALEKAEARGIAFQLTNILRDLAEDAERGRIYLPLEDLARFEVTEEALLARRTDGRLGDLVQFEVDRARSYYRASADLAEHVEPESRASLDAMTTIYSSVLDKVESLGQGVMLERARLTKLEKLALAGKTAYRGLKERLEGVS